MRNRTIKTIEKNIKEIELIYPDESLTDGGLVTYRSEVEKVVNLFKEKDIKGMIIGMMTFGEEIPNLLIGEAIPDDRALRGSWKWVKVEDLKKLYRTVIKEGFVHHASMIFGDLRKKVRTFCKFAGIDIAEV
jgi:L-fucose isomerase-like protein